VLLFSFLLGRSSTEEGLQNALFGPQFGRVVANVAYDLTERFLKFSILQA